MAEASITANDRRTAPPIAAPRHRAERPASTRHPAAAAPISKRVTVNTHALTASLAPVRADLGVHCWLTRSAWRVLIGSHFRPDCPHILATSVAGRGSVAR